MTQRVLITPEAEAVVDRLLPDRGAGMRLGDRGDQVAVHQELGELGAGVRLMITEYVL